MKENRNLDATLDHASIGQALTVHQVLAPQAAPEWARWLEEIGFIVGEQVMLMARALPGGDPLVVRIGQSTFALRRAEAACVRVLPAAQVELAAVVLEGSRA
ncbi:MAG: putative ferrous iron transport protein [Proteobacteria bacterium]|nr:putative ferrous iron transport protein [Pseudomonadota bacterium]